MPTAMSTKVKIHRGSLPLLCIAIQRGRRSSTRFLHSICSTWYLPCRRRDDFLLCVLALFRVLPTRYVKYIKCLRCSIETKALLSQTTRRPAYTHYKNSNKIAWLCSAKRNKRPPGQKPNAIKARILYYTFLRTKEKQWKTNWTIRKSLLRWMNMQLER